MPEFANQTRNHAYEVRKKILRQLYIKKSLKTLIDESRIELASEDMPTYLFSVWVFVKVQL